jgi:prepilin-type N-terminal cleavage/methylation domain-containing protein
VDQKGGFAMNNVKRSQRPPVGQGGFTLIELIIVVAVISIVAAIVIPLYANVSHGARTAKAQADTSALACAVRLYADHMGTLPPALTVLMFPAVNGLNQSAGPFMASIPNPPPGGSPAWGAYTYTSSTAGTFSITATGDGATVTRRGTPDQAAAGASPNARGPRGQCGQPLLGSAVRKLTVAQLRRPLVSERSGKRTVASTTRPFRLVRVGVAVEF